MTGTAGEGFGGQPLGEIARAMVAAQEQSLEVARTWSESLRALVVDQAEGGRAALEALSATLTATQQALASQEETNRALRQSLEAYQEVVERAGATQLVQAAAGGVSGAPATPDERWQHLERASPEVGINSGLQAAK